MNGICFAVIVVIVKTISL